MSDIFISYAREDEARAKSLALALQKHGYSVWWDKRIPPGKTWRNVIEEALGEAKCVIVLWSKKSVESSFVQEEAEFAKSRGKLVPVFIDDVEPPFGFRGIEGANLVGWRGQSDNDEFLQLLRSVEGLAGKGAGGRGRAPTWPGRSRARHYLVLTLLAVLAAGLAFHLLWQEPPAEPRESGHLSIEIAPWAQVRSVKDRATGQPVATELFRGKFLDKSPVTPCFLSLPAGEYDIELAHPSYPDPLVRTVVVKAGETVVLHASIPGFHHAEFVPQL